MGCRHSRTIYSYWRFFTSIFKLFNCKIILKTVNIRLSSIENGSIDDIKCVMRSEFLIFMVVGHRVSATNNEDAFFVEYKFANFLKYAFQLYIVSASIYVICIEAWTK